jgi:hypothetical protein
MATEEQPEKKGSTRIPSKAAIMTEVRRGRLNMTSH